MGIFLNFSNHASANWSEQQRQAAEIYGEIEDMPFPDIRAEASEEETGRLAEKYVRQIVEKQPDAVMCQGEYTFTFAVVSMLVRRGILCVAACSRRVAVEEIREDGSAKKQSVFVFEKFREYRLGQEAADE